MAGLTPRQLRKELAEHGSYQAMAVAHPELAEWPEAARRISEQLRAVTSAIESVRLPLELAEPERIDELPLSPEALQLELLREIADNLARIEPNEKPSGAVISFDLVELVVRKKMHEHLGRRELGNLPGVGEWWASQIMRWYQVGKPAGLWLDEDDQLCWGAAIAAVGEWEQREQANAPTPCMLALPRI